MKALENTVSFEGFLESSKKCLNKPSKSERFMWFLLNFDMTNEFVFVEFAFLCGGVEMRHKHAHRIGNQPPDLGYNAQSVSCCCVACLTALG